MHHYPLYLCIAGVYCRYRIEPDHDISCVTLSNIDCTLQMFQIPILGGMLKEGPQDSYLFHGIATLPISHTHFQLLLSDITFYHQ